MCQYIKDNGEQCGRTAEPFCHDHDDTGQAKLWVRMDGLFERLEALEDAQSGSDIGTMDTTCDECGATLRRRERLTEHPHQNRRVLFEPYVECDCGEYVLGAKSVRESNVPDGWSP